MEKMIIFKPEELDAIKNVIAIIDNGKGINGSQLIKAICLALSKWYQTKEGYENVPGAGELISRDKSIVTSRNNQTITLREIIRYLEENSMLFHKRVPVPNTEYKRTVYRTIPWMGEIKPLKK